MVLAVKRCRRAGSNLSTSPGVDQASSTLPVEVACRATEVPTKLTETAADEVASST